jgi:hypothetical protein
MYSEEELDKIHKQLLEQLSTIDICSNFILTDNQYKYAIENNKPILKPYIYNRNYTKTHEKEYIDIRELVIEKLKKYKIIGIETGIFKKYDEYINMGNRGGSSCRDYEFYIVYININGDCYANTMYKDNNYNRFMLNYYNNIVIITDWYLELFIKPFAIKPSSIPNSINGYPNTTNLNDGYDNLNWYPFINPDYYIAKQMKEEPKYINYTNTNNIIPFDFINQLFTNKLNKEVIKKILISKYNIIDVEKDVKLYLFDICYLIPILKTLKQNYQNCVFKFSDYRNKSINCKNIYDFYQEYKAYIDNIEHKEQQKKANIEYEKNRIKLLENNITIETNNNILTIKNYYKPEINLCDYLECKKKNILINGKLISINYTDINKIIIINSNIKIINKYYQGIKKIELYECPYFEKLPYYLQKDLIYFSIDDNVIIKK